jgi:hypothetical protein
MTAQAYQTDDGQLVQEQDRILPENNQAGPDADQTWHQDPTWQPASTATLADAESATPLVPDYSGLTPVGDGGADEPEMAGSNAESPSPVSVVTMAPDSVTESHLGGNTASGAGPWNEVLAMFVDDPRASLERANGLLDDRVEALIQSVRERQGSMRSAWLADDAGTEELRMALQRYRAFWNSLEDFPARA